MKIKLILLSLTISSPTQVLAQDFDRSLLEGAWVVNSNTDYACTENKLHTRFKLSADGKTLKFIQDREWKLNSGKTVEHYSATVISNTNRVLTIKYNTDAGEHPPNYPKEWEMAFVAPGVYRWRATNWPRGRVNVVVGIRCSQ